MRSSAPPTTLEDCPWDSLEEVVTDFQNDCVGFEFQVQGLFNEIETLYQTLQARCIDLEKREQQWVELLGTLQGQQDKLLAEIAELRRTVDRQADRIEELLK